MIDIPKVWALDTLKIRQHYFPIFAGERRTKDQDLSFFSLRRCVVNKWTLAWRDEEGFLGMLKMKKGKSRSGNRGNESRIPLFLFRSMGWQHTEKEEEGRRRRVPPPPPKPFSTQKSKAELPYCKYFSKKNFCYFFSSFRIFRHLAHSKQFFEINETKTLMWCRVATLFDEWSSHQGSWMDPPSFLPLSQAGGRAPMILINLFLPPSSLHGWPDEEGKMRKRRVLAAKKWTLDSKRFPRLFQRVNLIYSSFFFAPFLYSMRCCVVTCWPNRLSSLRRRWFGARRERRGGEKLPDKER